MGKDDPDAWADLASGWERLGRRLDASYALYREAGASGRGARRRATEALVRAHELSLQMPARPLARMIERAGARIDYDLGRGRTSHASRQPSTHASVADLTDREREVAELITRGASDREIAVELLITEKTASNHVSNIISKLGARRRNEVATLVDRSLG